MAQRKKEKQKKKTTRLRAFTAEAYEIPSHDIGYGPARPGSLSQMVL